MMHWSLYYAVSQKQGGSTDTIIGTYDENGLNLARPIAVEYLELVDLACY